MDGEWLRIGIDGVVPVQWEASKADVEAGTLTGYASVWNVVDGQDDVVMRGAFRKTLSEWKASKRVIPLVLDHEHRTESVVGSLASAAEDTYGLKVAARFSGTGRAQEAREKAREGHLGGLSIFGPIFKKSFELRDGREIRILQELGLMEVSLTPFPANDRAMVSAAKTVSKAVTDRPWDGSPSRFTIEQWRRSTIIDTEQGEADSFGRYKLPVREPDGTINRNGVHAAAGGRGLSRVTGISAEKRRAAARTLVRLYRSDLEEDPPDSLLRAAGMQSSLQLPEDWVEDMRAALSIRVPHARKVAVDQLVAVRYGDPGQPPDGDGDGDGGGDQDGDDADGEDPAPEPGDAAAKYALELIGQASGPDQVPPGGEPSDSLADLLAPIQAAKTFADLDQLMAETGTDRE